MIGTTLGHFAITAKLGEGGMGEVWRATDTRLGREVAIKLLPDDFAVDPERHTRFEREAKLLAALNHPNVATLFGLEHLAGRHALVMELVPGVGLNERLTEGPMPLDEAVAVAVQIARGLEAAHEQGIVHRDLKPANVRVRPDGVVKVLDFGLAKAWQASANSHDMELSPTVTHLPTAAGVILGTAAYMAPEQARGKPVDRRADVWAFGVVLWEMLTGRRLFSGETLTDVIAAVVTFEPAWSELPASTPPALRRLLERCLRRDPRQRLPDIGACRLELEEIGLPQAADGGSRGLAAAPATRSRRAGATVAAAAALLALVAGATGGYRLALGRAEAPRMAFEIFPPEGTAGFFVHPERPGPVAVSPDGRLLAFTANDEQGYRLYVRPLASTRASAVPGTDGAQYPFWSPDSAQLGYFAAGAIRRVAVAGVAGPPVTVCAAAEMKGASWSPAGVIVFAPDAGSALLQVPATGGEPRPVTVLDAAGGEDSHRHPRFLPDGRRFLYLARVRGGGADSVVKVGSLDGGADVAIVASPAAAEYASGRLLFMRDGSLLAQPFDVGRLALSGAPAALVDDLRLVAPGTAAAMFSTSPGGVIAYQQEGTAGHYRLVWRDRSGGELGSLGDLAAYYDVRLSPDGSAAAVTVGTAAADQADVWLYDIARNLRTRLTFSERDEWGAAWSPDGHDLAFASDRNGSYDVFRLALGSSDAEQELLRSDRVLLPTGFSPDGRWLLVNEQGAKVAVGSWDIAVLDLTSGQTTSVVASAADEGIASFSPDGRWIAYHSTESGTFEVYVAPFPGPGRKWQVSRGGGLWPEWRGDGREVFYRTTNAVFAVAVDTAAPRPVIGEPERLFAVDTNESANYRFSAAPDGQRFLVIEPASGVLKRPVVVEVGWPQRLTGSAPGPG